MVQGVLIEDGCIVSTDPASGAELGRVVCTSPAELAQTVARARAAYRGWHATPLPERVATLKRAVAGLGHDEGDGMEPEARARAAEQRARLAEQITLEMGKPLEEAADEVSGAVDKAGYLDLIEQANAPVAVENGLMTRAAHGVVALMTPWNFPADEILLLALPALAAGNAVVVKPSEMVPMTGKIVVEGLQRELPPDVIQLAQGDGSVGRALVTSEGVDMVAMTGSTGTGKKIMAGCAERLKRLVLELGGKDPMVVFADADLDRAASDAVTYSLYNTGQVCCSVERVYVAETIKNEFESKVRALAEKFVAGPGRDPTSKIGPLVSRVQRDHVAAQVEGAIKQGARLVCQAPAPSMDEPGNFYPATVLADVGHAFDISTNETFGPVVALTTFSGSEEEAVRLANDSEFGLAAYVYSSDLDKAQRVAMQIEAGQVGINNWTVNDAPVACPWSGAKQSGFGYHSGSDGWRQFSVPKSIIFAKESGIRAQDRR